MNNLTAWGMRHGITLQAMQELSFVLQGEPVAKTDTSMSENAVSQRIRLKASHNGMRLFRNNVGACETIEGRQIRYGLANESTRINSDCKSADFIGITPVIIQPSHVGRMFGLFTSIEVKRGDAPINVSTGREKAQNNWKNVIESLGGIAKFANCDTVIDEILTESRL